MDRRLMGWLRRWKVALVAGAILAGWAPPASAAEGPDDCWRTLFAEFGRPPPPVIHRTLADGRELRIPAEYFRRGTPPSRIGPDDALWIFAAFPRLEPLTEQQAREFWTRPGASGWITVFVNPEALHGDRLLDAMRPFRGGTTRLEQTPIPGFFGLRFDEPMGIQLREIYVSRSNREVIIACTGEDEAPNPLCKLYLWLGGVLRIEATFRRVFLEQFPTIEAATYRFLACAGVRDIPVQR